MRSNLGGLTLTTNSRTLQTLLTYKKIFSVKSNFRIEIKIIMLEYITLIRGLKL